MTITSPRILAAGIVGSIVGLSAMCTPGGELILAGALIITLGGATMCVVESFTAGHREHRGGRVLLGVAGLLFAGAVMLLVVGVGSAGGCGGAN